MIKIFVFTLRNNISYIQSFKLDQAIFPHSTGLKTQAISELIMERINYYISMLLQKARILVGHQIENLLNGLHDIISLDGKYKVYTLLAEMEHTLMVYECHKAKSF